MPNYCIYPYFLRCQCVMLEHLDGEIYFLYIKKSTARDSRL